MIVATVSSSNTSGLPQSLKTAQAAIHLPEVQEMLRQLSKHKLGIYMPHMHSLQTGEFELLPDNVVQVESALEVSFRSTKEVETQPERFLPVGWCWQAGVSTSVAVCEMDDEEDDDDSIRSIKHKM